MTSKQMEVQCIKEVQTTGKFNWLDYGAREPWGDSKDGQDRIDMTVQIGDKGILTRVWIIRYKTLIQIVLTNLYHHMMSF